METQLAILFERYEPTPLGMTLTDRMRGAVPHDERSAPHGRALRYVGRNLQCETSGESALAADIIKTAVRDAIGMSDTRAKQYQDIRSHYGRVDGALEWLRVTVDRSEPGTLGFWSAVAGVNAQAILEAVEREIERMAA